MGTAGHDPSHQPALLVRDVVRDVISEVAPEELPLVDRLRRLDDEQVLKLLTRRRRRRDLLGFGLSEMVALASPVVWVVASEAAKRFTNSAITGSGKAAKAGLRKLFRRAKTASVVPPLTKEQIEDVWTKTRNSALSNGMDQQRAESLADAVMRRLLVRGQILDDPADGDSPEPN